MKWNEWNGGERDEWNEVVDEPTVDETNQDFNMYFIVRKSHPVDREASPENSRYASSEKSNEKDGRWV